MVFTRFKLLMFGGAILGAACTGEISTNGPAPFCDGASPAAACGDPTCRAALVDHCGSDPHISFCGCDLVDGWQTCGDPSLPCPANMECRALSINSCLDDAAACFAELDVCWAGPRCSTFTTKESCSDSGCRWLVPGCPQGVLPTLPTPGCYAQGDCAPYSTACTQGETCTQLTYGLEGSTVCSASFVTRVCASF